MEKKDLKQFVFDCCHFLNIMVMEMENQQCFTLNIPSELKTEFGHSIIHIAFHKVKDQDITYLTPESFVLQKMADLVAQRATGVSTGLKTTTLDDTKSYLAAIFSKGCKLSYQQYTPDRNDELLVWYKLMLRGYFIEENLIGFKYSFSKQSIELLPEDAINTFEQITEANISSLPSNDFESAFDKIQNFAEKKAEQFWNNKKDKIDIKLREEVKRINDYYRHLKAQKGTTQADQEELRLLEHERENLIDQLKKKYAVSKEGLFFEPIALLFLRNEIERAWVKVQNKFGSSQFEVLAGVKPKLLCKRTQDKTGPFTVTSDNLIVLQDQTTECNWCGKLRDNERIQSCAACQKDMCLDCVKTSYISGNSICVEHSRECRSCKEIVGIHEVRECGGKCNQLFCGQCLPDSQECQVCHCALCSDCLYLSSFSEKSFCQNHIKQCQCCLNNVGITEFSNCSSCGQTYCKTCIADELCEYCRNLEPLKQLSPLIQKALGLTELSARNYESYMKGNRLYILGKGRLFKSFLLCFDIQQKQVIVVQKYRLFNRKTG